MDNEQSLDAFTLPLRLCSAIHMEFRIFDKVFPSLHFLSVFSVRSCSNSLLAASVAPRLCALAPLR
jgi:hypothetical protein